MYLEAVRRSKDLQKKNSLYSGVAGIGEIGAGLVQSLPRYTRS